MLIKHGVTREGLSYEAREALRIMCEVIQEDGDEPVLTSAAGGAHMHGSKHYSGDAVDVTGRYECEKRWADHARGRLSQRYDVVYELDHIHIEYDPGNK